MGEYIRYSGCVSLDQCQVLPVPEVVDVTLLVQLGCGHLLGKLLQTFDDQQNAAQINNAADHEVNHQ